MCHQRRPQRIGAPSQPAEPQAERKHEDGVRRFDMGSGEQDRAHHPGGNGSPAAGHPTVKQAAKHRLLDQRRQQRHHNEARHEHRRRARDIQRLLDALRLDAELADRNRNDQGAYCAQQGRPEVGHPKAQGRQGPPAQGGDGDGQRNQP